MGITRYVDATMPDNTGDGLTPQTAKKYIDTVLRLLNRTADQVVRVRGGYHYDVEPGTSWNNGLGVSNVTIEAYWLPGDEPGNPMIDGVNWIAADSGGWTLEGAATAGGYVWSKQIGTAQSVRRVWAGSFNNGIKLSQRKLGEALRRPPDANFGGQTATTDDLNSIKAHLNVDDAWYGAGSALAYKLYMWTPTSEKDPSRHYNGLGLAQAGAGTLGIGNGISLFNTKNFRISNIDVRGATGWSFQIATVDNYTTVTEDIYFYRCKSIGAISAFRASQIATLAYLVNIRRVEFRECVADPWTSAKEQEPNQAYNKLSGSDQYLINGKVEDVSIVDCVGYDPTHAAISMGAWEASGGLPKRSGYLRHKVKASSWCSYARSLNIANCEDSCYVTNCTIEGTNVVAQLAGACRVTGNTFTGLRKYIRKPNNANNTTDGWVAVSCYRGDLFNTTIGDDRYFDLRPDGLIFANNTCDGCYGTPVEVSVFTSGLGPSKPQPSLRDYSFFFWNNVFIDSVPERWGKPYLTTYQDGALTVGIQSFNNNVVYSPDGSVPSAKWIGTSYADINTAPGHAANLTVDPKIDKNMRPQPGSPVIGAAKFAGFFRDVTGRKFRLPGAIGAVEALPPTRVGVAKARRV